MKKPIIFRITYCYGGRFLGDTKYTRDIEADNKEEAIKKLYEKWNVEQIIYIEEINHNSIY
ncbi:MAG: hypothetical protein ABR927_15695 [Bacteroidales bacterium]|jgi:hypothetical protein